MKRIFLFVLFTFSLLFSFQEDEYLKFKIKYGFVTAGYATLEVGNYTYKDSIECLTFTSKARTHKFFDSFFQVRDRIVSVWDKEKQVSRKFEKKLQEGSYRQHRTQFFFPENNFSIYTKYDYKKEKFKEKQLDILDNTQDLLSSFYVFRKMNFAVGDTASINVSMDGKNYPIKVVVHKTEKLDTIFGKKECYLIEPFLKGDAIFKQEGRISIWLTKDDYKIPVKLKSKVKVGSFKVYLEEAKNVPYKKK